MIDIGVNLLHPQFDIDRAAVVRRARDAGVDEMLITCTDLETSEAAIEYCRAHDMYCTAGIHPHDAKDAPADLIERLQRLAHASRVKAIGETGLDFNRNYSPETVQREVFEIQLGIAQSCRLPVFVHDRDSRGATFDMLAAHIDGLSGVVVHCFTGDRSELARYLSIGCYIGITGWVCDRRRGGELRKLVTHLPLDRILIETDAPFLLPDNAPEGWLQVNSQADKRRNEPALLPFVAAQIAEAMAIDPIEVGH
ncbi:MAG: TatD family hydrolase, partial [Pseudomonadales bacterium]